MIVQCPRCSMRWRVADAAEGDNPVFKCGRCHNVFRRFPGAPLSHERTPSAGRSRTTQEADNLEFIFPRHRPPSAPGDGGEDAAPAATADDNGDADIRGEPELPDDADLDTQEDSQLHTLSGDRAPSDDAEPDPNTSALDLEESYGPDESDTEVLPPPPEQAWTLNVEDTMRASAPIAAFGPIRRLLLILVAAYALLTVLIRANPERGAQWLTQIPLLGAALSEQPALVRDVQLRNVEGRFDHLRNARLVFVVSGETVNNSRSALDRIEIEATLWGPNGELGRKSVSTGNRTTLRLGELSESEVVLLQRFDPRVTLAPGESAQFAIVFLEPPRNLKEFSSRVSSVRPTDPSSARPPTDQARRPASLG